MHNSAADTLQSLLERASKNPGPASGCQCNFGLLDGIPCSGCESGAARQRMIDEYAANRKALAAEEGRQREADLMAKIAEVIPPKYVGMGVDSYEASLDGAGVLDGKSFAIEAARSFIRGECQTLIIYTSSDRADSGYGTGKTQLACAALFDLMNQGKSGQYWNFGNLMHRIRASYRGNDDGVDLVSAAQEVDNLLLDDIGRLDASSTATDHTAGVLDVVMRYRYDYQKPTIITSNLTPTQLKAEFDEKAYRPMSDGAVMAELGGAKLG